MTDGIRQKIMELVKAAYMEGHISGGYEGIPDTDWLESDALAAAKELFDLLD